jgi:hypothetical protein
MKAQQHSDTSVAAGVSIAPAACKMRALVLAWIETTGATGATDEEIQEALAMNPSTQRPRRGELVERGWVADSGRCRNTRSGRGATVWVRVGGAV